MSLIRICILCLAMVLCAPASGIADTDAMFTSLNKKVDDYLEAFDRYDKAPDDSWLPSPFSETKSEVSTDLNKLLDAALSSLLDDRLLELKRQITELNRSRNKIQAENADLEMKRLVAPAEKMAYEFWKNSVADIDEEIAENERRIVEIHKKITEIKGTIQLLLDKAGMPLPMDEIDSLVNIVTGTDTIESMVVLKNVQAVLDKLKGLVSGENENIHIARKYYGLFLLATQTYEYQLDMFIRRIDDKYLPKLETVRDANAKLMKETRKLAAKDAYYAGNLKAQQITGEAAELYESALRSQKKLLNERGKEVARILSLATNTYKTVSLAHSLYGVMNKGMSSYRSLMSLPLIYPVPFRNKDLEAKFLELTQQLNE